MKGTSWAALTIVFASLVGLGGWWGIETLVKATTNQLWGILVIPLIILVVVILEAGRNKNAEV